MDSQILCLSLSTSIIFLLGGVSRAHDLSSGGESSRHQGSP